MNAVPDQTTSSLAPAGTVVACSQRGLPQRGTVDICPWLCSRIQFEFLYRSALLVDIGLS
jgi:hypothetical protein